MPRLSIFSRLTFLSAAAEVWKAVNHVVTMFQPFHAFAGGYHSTQRSRHKISGRNPFRARDDQPCHGTDARRSHRPMGRQSGTRGNVRSIFGKFSIQNSSFLAHIVWKLLNMSHLKFWHFTPIFELLKVTCLATLFDHKLFKNSLKWQNVNVARFARILAWDFFSVIFKHRVAAKRISKAKFVISAKTFVYRCNCNEPWPPRLKLHGRPGPRL